ncbi:hypothetical protein [Nocardioides sp. NPDC006303]|uniref:hypothetical protein n=1 Tax=Nocardioides sp. NPDC006303 TaxID=3156747 RepID=UPI0033A95561
MDDVAVLNDVAGFALFQAKVNLRCEAGTGSPLAKAAAQAVAQFVRGELADGNTAMRPFDSERDIIVLCTDAQAPRTISKDLRDAVIRVGSEPAGTPLTQNLSRREAKALDTFLGHVRRSWSAMAIPGDEDLRRLLRCVRVLVMDLEPGGSEHEGALTAIGAVLNDPSSASAAWDVLIAEAQRAAVDRSWRVARELWNALGRRSIHAKSASSDPTRGSGPEREPNRRECADRLLRASDARRRDRLAPFQIEPAALEPEFAALRGRLPNVAPGEVRVLVGRFGSGKSETAEEWHRQAVTAYGEGRENRIPLWVDAVTAARQLDNPFVAEGHDRDDAVLLVVDGLDEVDGSEAERLLRDVRLCVADGNSAAMVTTRPNVLDPGLDGVDAGLLTEDEARELIERLSDRRHWTYSWPRELLDSVRSPFFALAAARRLGSGDVGRGEADLIRGLVEEALSRASGQSATSEGGLFSLLVHAAASLTDNAGQDDGLNFLERQRLRATRLVTIDGGQVRFPLPIFEQWFAAQSLLEPGVEVAARFAGPSSFSRWRWAIAIAILSAQARQIDAILAVGFDRNVGAASWIVQEVSKHRGWREPSASTIPQAEAERRLLAAVRTWADGLGPASGQLLPVAADGGGVQLGVRSGPGRFLAIGRRVGSFAEDACTVLPNDVHPLVPIDQIPAGWWPIQTGVVDSGALWPWSAVQHWVARAVIPMLEGHDVLGPDDGVWACERSWRAARILTGRRGMLHDPIPMDEVRERVADHIDPLRGAGVNIETDPVQITIEGKVITGFDLVRLGQVATASGPPLLARPVPAPDVRPTDGGAWAWNLYSRPTTVAFCAEMMGLACQAYDEALEGPLRRFGWSLGRGAGGPFGILGITRFRGTGLRWEDRPVMEYVQVPVAMFEELADHRALIRSANGRAAFLPALSDDDASVWWEDTREKAEERIRGEFRLRSECGPFWRMSSASSVIETNHERPASQRAAKWIFDDLKKLGAAEGTSPQLSW